MARSLIIVIARVSFSFVALGNTMPDNVEKVTPIASSSAVNYALNAAPPVVSAPSVPSSVPAPSSSGAGPSTAHVATHTSSAAHVLKSPLFHTLGARAPVVPVSAPIVPSTPSGYTRFTGTAIGNVNEVVGSELKESAGSPELVMPRLSSRCLFCTDCSLCHVCPVVASFVRTGCFVVVVRSIGTIS